MRAFPPVYALPAAAALFLLPVSTAHATPRGDSGTVRVHDTVDDTEIPPGGPAVCTFYLVGEGFDGAGRVTWQIAQRTGSGEPGTVAETGTLVVDGGGYGRTDGLSLADGAYELFWDLGADQPPTSGGPFTVRCDGEGAAGGGGDGKAPGGGPDGGTAPSASAPGAGRDGSAGPSPGGDPGRGSGTDPDARDAPQRDADRGGGPGTAPTADGPAGPDPAVTEPPGPSPQGEGDLARSGSDVPAGAFAAVGAALLGAGAYLVLRRRRAPGPR
ncbi:LPXTG cell wall anchor domain-containing protein [Streptomyces sp. Z26]|uniref:LPXTG cell wall anchor domain-containing protein n=1 Tax=Streptomyces sp. Z26 TaxID=2500177 RepID=UPI0014051CC8|nr:LPXTG cell wall anchor domain-containing protein [Streptomyces sp. Z26]